jgi:Ca2+-binding EF-hand superfamily protein
MPSADELFKKFDTNNDGVISKEEFAAGLKKVQEHLHHRMHGPMGPGSGPQAGPAYGPHPPRPAELFDRFDKNKDGKLTKDEVPAGVWERMSKADANKDGAVTKDELEAFHKKRVEERGHQPPK